MLPSSKGTELLRTMKRLMPIQQCVPSIAVHRLQGHRDLFLPLLLKLLPADKSTGCLLFNKYSPPRRNAEYNSRQFTAHISVPLTICSHTECVN